MAKSQWYVAGKRLLAEGKCDLSTDELRVVLVTKSYTCDYREHRRYDDLSWEAEGKGYRKGGLKLPNQRLVTLEGRVYLQADPIKIDRTTLRAAGACIVHQKTGTLIAYLSMAKETDKEKRDREEAESFEHDFTIEWPKEGIVWV